MTTTKPRIRIEKRTFCGVELDIILGHPAHDVLFFATQALQAAGMKVAKQAVQDVKMDLWAAKNAFQYKEMEGQVSNFLTFKSNAAPLQHSRWKDTWLFTEPALTSTLLRGHSPSTEPFRKWVNEEVLPTIRKTGSYNITESVTPEAKQFAEQNADVTALVGLVKVLVEQNAEMMKMLMAGREVVSTVEPPKPVGEWKNARQWLDTFYLPIPPKFGMEHVGSISQALIRLANVLGLKVRKTQPCLFPRELADRALMGLTIKPADQVNQEKLTGAILEHIDGVRELEAHQRRLALEAVS